MSPDTHTYCQSEDDVCITRMTVEWAVKGEQVATLQRQCGPVPAFPGGNHCRDDFGNLYQAKECLDYCEGNLCNSNTDVLEYFDEGTDIECYGCQYGQDNQGNVLPDSNIYCQSPSVDGLVPPMKCPVYANAACFTAATWHYENGAEFEEDFKGCSTFKYDDEDEICSDYLYNGITYKNCRSTCSGDGCNPKTPTKKMSCYTCDHTMDAEGNFNS